MTWPLMLLSVIIFMSVLIGGYMYLQWAKVRDAVATSDKK